MKTKSNCRKMPGLFFLLLMITVSLCFSSCSFLGFRTSIRLSETSIDLASNVYLVERHLPIVELKCECQPLWGVPFTLMLQRNSEDDSVELSEFVLYETGRRGLSDKRIADQPFFLLDVNTKAAIEMRQKERLQQIYPQNTEYDHKTICAKACAYKEIDDGAEFYGGDTLKFMEGDHLVAERDVILVFKPKALKNGRKYKIEFTPRVNNKAVPPVAYHFRQVKNNNAIAWTVGLAAIIGFLVLTTR